LRQKIIDSNDLTPEELAQVNKNEKLLDIYRNRWWNPKCKNSYFIFSNTHATKSLRANEEVFYSYGERSNAYLFLFYGFCLDHKNKFDSLDIRLNSTNLYTKKKPSEVLKDLLPNYNDDMRDTELFKFRMNKLPLKFMTYLRTLMASSYLAADKQFIDLQTPKVVQFEMLVCKKALQLLKVFGQKYHKTTLQSDLAAERERVKYEHHAATVLRFNIGQKQIFASQVGLFTTLLAFLETIAQSPDFLDRQQLSQVEWQRITFQHECQFEVRMGLSKYFETLANGMKLLATERPEQKIETGIEYKVLS
jgi:hypothetical protein